MSGLTIEDLKKAYDEAAAIHKNHLASQGVKLPAWGTIRGYQLAVLFHRSPDFVDKDEISDIIREHNPTAATDQQVRHLFRDGWNLESDGKGSHKIVDPCVPNPIYKKQLIKSQILLTAGDFDTIKRAFECKCATCNAKEGEYHHHYGRIVKLQKGHKDPEKQLNWENTIPQCQFCNQAYKDDFTFDDNGRVRAIASPAPVLRASNDVKKNVMEKLTDDKSKKGW